MEGIQANASFLNCLLKKEGQILLAGKDGVILDVRYEDVALSRSGR